MNFGQMQTEVRRRLNESTTVFFSDQDVKDALNEGYAQMADVTEFYERYVNIPMLSKRTYYDLTHIITETFLSPRRVFNTTTNRWLDPTDPFDMDYHTYVQWELVQGQPEKCFMRGNWFLGVWPKPSGDLGQLRFYHTAIPDAMSRSTDEPEFPREFRQGVIDYALCELLADQKETAKAMLHYAAYETYEKGLKAYVEGRTTIAGVRAL